MASVGPIRAAGGVVERGGDVVLVHRPRYDDWSLPKGKIKRAEHPLLGAVREVYEETGVRGAPGVRLPGADYEAPLGGSLVDKHVDFWAMKAVDIEAFTPNDEVDDVAWVPVATALEQLSYARDQVVLRAYADLPPLHRPVAVVPAATGLPQSAATAVLTLLRPGRLVSAPPCREALGPLEESLRLHVEVDERFAAGTDPRQVVEALRDLANPDAATVVCTVDAVVAEVSRLLTGHDTARGDGAVISFARDTTAVLVDPLTLA